MNAKSVRATATNVEAILSPKTVANAAVMSSEPGLTPNGISTPEQMMVRAVREQITMVSAKHSKIPYIPCWTGPGVSAAECAIAAEPRPASLENAERRRPQTMVSFRTIPAAAPPIACGLNAVEKILPNAGMMLPAWTTITVRPKTI